MGPLFSADHVGYCENMKNAIRSSTIRPAARRYGAWRWLSSLVRAFRRSRSGAESAFDRLAKEEIKIREGIENFDGGARLARDVLYDRKLGRLS